VADWSYARGMNRGVTLAREARMTQQAVTDAPPAQGHPGERHPPANARVPGVEPIDAGPIAK
jgi:hypothetical protein